MRHTLDFLLYEWLHVDALTERPRFSDHSAETFASVLDASERIAKERFAPFNRLVDTEEPHFDGEHVRLPQATTDATKAYAKSGLLAAGHDYDVGGMQLPYVVDMAANTFFSMASIGLSAYGMLSYANANLVMAHGTEVQKQAFALPILDGRFLGTMCLSEPQAGSSLGDITTRAEPDGDDFEADTLGPRYRIKGNKMWISGGEHEISENIVHLVLAKIPGADGKAIRGVKGISLFIVPRVMVDTGGKLTGERNDVALAGLNHKLGYRGIPNTLLNFGEGSFPVGSRAGVDNKKAGAIGYRIGASGCGLEVMFHMMNEARINVGMGATMLGYAGYVASLEYARLRTQGRSIGPDGKNPDATPVSIIAHADVKRMLLAQKSYCEGGLALGLYCARLVDEKATGSSAAVAEAAQLLDILTPVAKSWPSEWCLEANSLAIQIHGGYGYTRDFQVEQFWRDNRLNMIHEGTHGIQGLDLLGRKVIAGGGMALKLWERRAEETIARASAVPSLKPQALKLKDAVVEVCGAPQAAWATGSADEALANATAYLQAFGHTVLAWLWLDIAITASEQLGEKAGNNDGFLRGKLQAMRYFYEYELPKAKPLLVLVATRNAICREMSDTWF